MDVGKKRSQEQFHILKKFKLLNCSWLDLALPKKKSKTKIFPYKDAYHTWRRLENYQLIDLWKAVVQIILWRFWENLRKLRWMQKKSVFILCFKEKDQNKNPFLYEGAYHTWSRLENHQLNCHVNNKNKESNCQNNSLNLKILIRFP